MQRDPGTTDSTRPKLAFAAGQPPVAPVQVLTAAGQDHPIELRTLSLSTTETSVPALVGAQVGVRDAGGNWRRDVFLPPIRLDDVSVVPTEETAAPPGAEAEAEPPEGPELQAQPKPATLLINFLLSSKVDGTDPLAVHYQIADGTPLLQALPAVIYWQIPPVP